ncbi:MAG: WG repeat-containing protein, partial [Oscillospiraceae bacterium]|nr:WG repeat-containing protein [Oscillospiraceae bacterium]
LWPARAGRGAGSRVLPAKARRPAPLSCPTVVDARRVTSVQSGTADVSMFSYCEGLARFLEKGKYGYVDMAGNIVVAPQYDSAGDFSQGRAVVGNNGKFGYIDKKGAVVAPLNYDTAEPFSEGLAAVSAGGKYGFIDRSGKVAVQLKYGYASPFSDGLAAVRAASAAAGPTGSASAKYGYIDASGAEAIPLQLECDMAYPFTEGLARIEVGGKFGFIDKSGEIIAQPAYDSAEPFTEGLAKVSRGGREGFVGRDGKPAIAIIYSFALSFREGMARVTLGEYPNARHGYIDRTGRIVIPVEYEEAADFSEGLALTRKNGVFAFIDKSGNAVLTPDFDFTRAFSNGLAAVGKGGFYGFIDKTGSLVVPLEYDYAYDFSGGLAWAAQDGRRLLLEIVEGEAAGYIYDGLEAEFPGYGLSGAEGTGNAGNAGNAGESAHANGAAGADGFADIASKPLEMRIAINALASLGVVNGISDTQFNPDGKLTRAEAAALIMRALSKLEPGADGKFEDVSAGDWFFGAVGSAKKYGIMGGVSATAFDPRGALRKDQLVAAAARALRTQTQCEDPQDVDLILCRYWDSELIAEWARTDAALAAQHGLVPRRPDGRFDGASAVTRGEAAVIVYRLVWLVSIS